MPYYWDFRTILNIDPETDRTCVGTTARGLGCGNPINMADRGTAGRLLDQMDRSKSLKSSIDHLETLAELLLCKHKHNNHKSFAYLSQVDRVSARWVVIVEEEYRIVKRRTEKEKAFKAKLELQRVAESAKQMKAELEEKEERLSYVPLKTSRNESSSRNDSFRTTTAGLYDPFVTATSSLRANNILPKPSKADRQETAKSTVLEDTTSKPHTLVKIEQVEIGRYDSSPPRKSDLGLPTPESTPRDLGENLKQRIDQGNTPTPTPMKQRENLSQALTPPSSIKVTRKTFTFEFGPGLDLKDGSKPKFEGVKAATEQTWSFPVFKDEKEQVGEYSSVPSSQKQLLPSPAMEASVPRIPLREKGTSSHNGMKARKPKTEYEFGNQGNMPFKNFNFEVNTPRALSAPETSGKIAPSAALMSAQSFAFDQPGDDTTRILDGKGTQGQSETPDVSVPHDNSKSEPSSMFQLSSRSELASTSQLTPKSRPPSDINQSSMSQKAIEIHLDTGNESTTAIEASTPSTIVEFPSDIRSQTPPSSPSKKTNLQHQIPSPPHKLDSSYQRSPSPSFGTALIIPPSIPYKTHLPTRLTTAPQTSSHSTQSQSPTVQSPSSYAADLQIWERIERMEKPLPHLPWEPLKGEMRKASAVRVGEGREEEEENVGCLGSGRLGKWRMRIWAKIRSGES